MRASTLKWWKWHLGAERRQATAAAREPTLLPVVFSAEPVTSAAAQVVTIELPHGVSVRVPVGADTRYVAGLVAALRTSC